jgi:hypothetical protein
MVACGVEEVWQVASLAQGDQRFPPLVSCLESFRIIVSVKEAQGELVTCSAVSSLLIAHADAHKKGAVPAYGAFSSPGNVVSANP